MAYINRTDDLSVKIVKALIPFYLVAATTITVEGKELPDEEINISETSTDDSSVIAGENIDEESCEGKGCAIDYSYNIEETPVTPVEEQESPEEEIVIEQDEVIEDTPVPESETVTTPTQPVVYEETHTETYTESVTQEQETTSENLMLTDEETIELVEATIEDIEDEGEVLGVMVDVEETSDPMLIYVGLSVLGIIGFFKIKRNLG